MGAEARDRKLSKTAGTLGQYADSPQTDKFNDHVQEWIKHTVSTQASFEHTKLGPLKFPLVGVERRLRLLL